MSATRLANGTPSSSRSRTSQSRSSAGMAPSASSSLDDRRRRRSPSLSSQRQVEDQRARRRASPVLPPSSCTASPCVERAVERRPARARAARTGSTPPRCRPGVPGAGQREPADAGRASGQPIVGGERTGVDQPRSRRRASRRGEQPRRGSGRRRRGRSRHVRRGSVSLAPAEHVARSPVEGRRRRGRGRLRARRRPRRPRATGAPGVDQRRGVADDGARARSRCGPRRRGASMTPRHRSALTRSVEARSTMTRVPDRAPAGPPGSPVWRQRISAATIDGWRSASSRPISNAAASDRSSRPSGTTARSWSPAWASGSRSAGESSAGCGSSGPRYHARTRSPRRVRWSQADVPGLDDLERRPARAAARRGSAPSRCRAGRSRGSS